MKILVVDDQRSARSLMRSFLAALPGVEVREASSLTEARAALKGPDLDLALIDLRLSDDPFNRDGLTLVREAHARGGITPVVVTGSAEMGDIRAAMRFGAYDFVLKDELCEESLAAIVRSVSEHRGSAPRASVAPPPFPDGLVGRSAVMERLRELIRRVASSARPALVIGPTGAGKELVVQALHALGAHPEAPLLDVNCGAIPEALIESQLFGHEKGAFTGAERRQEGCFAAVGQGTLFLDELVELTLAQQARLLRVLETGRFRPVGSHAEQSFRGRVVAATHADLDARVARGTFREDLFYRLQVLVLRVPALAEHPEDIPDLVAHFTEGSGGRLRFTPAALAALGRHPWPGNVRQLRNLVDRLAVLVDGEVTPEVLRDVAAVQGAAPLPRGRSIDEILDAILAMEVPNKIDVVTAGLVDEALSRAEGNKSAAARMLGLDRKALDRRLARGRKGP